MNLSDFIIHVQSSSQPVVLLEGTRALPFSDAPRLTALAARLSTLLPSAQFRSGDSTGSDEMFLHGLATVPERVELIAPHDEPRISIKQARRRSLHDVSPETLRELVSLGIQASPRYSDLFNRYLGNELDPELQAKARDLLRDTLKVRGCHRARLAPATAALLYLNRLAPDRGNSGHTRRMCSLLDVPVWSQDVWLDW